MRHWNLSIRTSEKMKMTKKKDKGLHIDGSNYNRKNEQFEKFKSEKENRKLMKHVKTW